MCAKHVLCKHEKNKAVSPWVAKNGERATIRIFCTVYLHTQIL